MMNLLKAKVDRAISSATERGITGLEQLRVVVEKEILHHGILLAMNEGDYLSKLTFIGGTCLRACYGSNRFSEDLDFTGGTGFKRSDMADIKLIIESSLSTQYGLPVEVTEPTLHQESRNADTWKIRITTAPGRPDIPKQRINLDIAALPSYDIKTTQLQNHYGIHLGTEQMAIRAQSLEEIYTDKIVALALREGRIKNRDLWDMAWMTQQGIKPAMDLIDRKIEHHHSSREDFMRHLTERVTAVQNDPEIARNFTKEMQRFVPASLARDSILKAGFWGVIQNVAEAALRTTERHYTAGSGNAEQDFRM